MTEPKHETDETGREILVYESGMIRDVKTGHLIRPAEANIIRTSERGAQLGHIRHEHVKEKVRDRIFDETKAVSPPGAKIENADDAYAEGVAKTWSKAILSDSSYPRDSLSAIEVIGKIGDWLPRERRTEEPPPQGARITADIPVETLLELARKLKEASQAEEVEEVGGELILTTQGLKRM